MIEIKNLTKVYKNDGYDRVRALDNISFTVNSGDMLCVSGDTGSGKSTLLEILSGTAYADSGSVIFDGRDITAMRGRRAARARGELVGLILCDFDLMPDRTVLENIALPLTLGQVKIKKKQRLECCLEAAKKVGLFMQLDTPAGRLSGGQQQRVAIARALVADPMYIIADEPIAGLDAPAAEEILTLFKRLNGMGKTLVIVSNDRRVGEICNKHIHMQGGRIADTDLDR